MKVNTPKHHAKSFMLQMDKIVKDFKKFAKEDAKKKGGNVCRGTFEVMINDRYLTLRVECENADGEVYSILQEVEAYGEEIYQSSLSANAIFFDCQ